MQIQSRASERTALQGRRQGHRIDQAAAGRIN
jgi:hypothetical protein